MASGEFVKILLYTDVTRYLEFKQIGASYVYRDGRIAKVPSNETEALTSPLMGIFEKRRVKRFFEFLSQYKQEVPETHNCGLRTSRSLARLRSTCCWSLANARSFQPPTEPCGAQSSENLTYKQPS
jgi:RAB protein geranylgeranyltransferase component A